MVIGPYAPSAIARWAFYACFWAWGLFEVWTGSRTGAAGSLDRDRLSRYVLLSVNLLSFTLAFFATLLHRFDVTFFRPQLFCLGLALMLAGLVVRLRHPPAWPLLYADGDHPAGPAHRRQRALPLPAPPVLYRQLHHDLGLRAGADELAQPAHRAGAAGRGVRLSDARRRGRAVRGFWR